MQINQVTLPLDPLIEKDLTRIQTPETLLMTRARISSHIRDKLCEGIKFYFSMRFFKRRINSLDVIDGT